MSLLPVVQVLKLSILMSETERSVSDIRIDKLQLSSDKLWRMEQHSPIFSFSVVLSLLHNYYHLSEYDG
jgi:hypothetical protein